MICPPCRAGGAAMTQGYHPDVVREFHERCPGGTWCPCAHDTVSMLNRDRIREQEQPVRGVVE